MQMKAVKYDPDPEWGGLSPQDFGSSTGVRLNGFFVFESKQDNGLAPLKPFVGLLHKHCFM
jgi:hypothetical protein